MHQTTEPSGNLQALLTKLTTGAPIELPPWDLSHAERIEAMSQQGRIVAIDAETWWWYLDVLPPRWMRGDAFVFAEGYDRFRLFWRRGEEHFVRQLSEEETVRFCKLSGANRWH